MKRGDTLKFKPTGCRYAVPSGPILRKIRGIDGHGRPLVRFAGYADFIVRPHEIIEVIPAAKEEPDGSRS